MQLTQEHFDKAVKDLRAYVDTKAEEIIFNINDAVATFEENLEPGEHLPHKEEK